MLLYQQLLPELREMIVMKSVMALFNSLGGVTIPGNDVPALTTVMSVCSDWHQLITGRHFNQRLLRVAVQGSPFISRQEACF